MTAIEPGSGGVRLRTSGDPRSSPITPNPVADLGLQLGEPQRITADADLYELHWSNAFDKGENFPIGTTERQARMDAEIDAESAKVGASLESAEGYFEAVALLQELALEREYLQAAADGDMQLYLYDRDASRTVEMLGPYYTGPDPIMTTDWLGLPLADMGVLLANHNLVASDAAQNNKVLTDLERWLYK